MVRQAFLALGGTWWGLLGLVVCPPPPTLTNPRVGGGSRYFFLKSGKFCVESENGGLREIHSTEVLYLSEQSKIDNRSIMDYWFYPLLAVDYWFITTDLSMWVYCGVIRTLTSGDWALGTVIDHLLILDYRLLTFRPNCLMGPRIDSGPRDSDSWWNLGPGRRAASCVVWGSTVYWFSVIDYRLSIRGVAVIFS